MAMTQTADLWGLLEPYLAAEHLELDDLEMNGQGKGRVLRVVVDGDEIHIDRLAELSRSLSRLLDNESDLEGAYQLEVSSPGLERKLRRPSHYEKSVGREVVAKVHEGETKETIRGQISAVSEKGFSVETDEGIREISFDQVATAKTVFRWEKAPKPGH